MSYNLKSGGFKALLKIAMENWTREQCQFVLTDANPAMRKVAQYVIDKKFKPSKP